MYEGYWKLRKKPFSQRTTADELYPTQSQQAAIRRLNYCLDNRCGIAVLIGTSGVGKTALLKYLAQSRPELQPCVTMIFPSLSADEMLRVLVEELRPELDGRRIDELRTDELLRTIQRQLHRFCEQEQHPVICFDDAHQLSDGVIQNVIQPLATLADISDDLQFSLILSGQPVLLSHLRRHTNVGDRIGVTASLHGMTRDETIEYIRWVLRHAGASASIFSPAAMERLFEVSGGIPRRINRLCDMALLVGCAEQLQEISVSEVDAISHELIPMAA